MKLAHAARDASIEHRSGHRSAHARVSHRQPLAAELELVNGMAPHFADRVIDLAGAAIEDEVVDHVLEEAEHAMLWHVDRFVHPARLDDRSR